MGTVISFPAEQRAIQSGQRGGQPGPGMVIILPVVRVERKPDEPSGDGLESGSRGARKRRRRASRS